MMHVYDVAQWFHVISEGIPDPQTTLFRYCSSHLIGLSLMRHVHKTISLIIRISFRNIKYATLLYFQNSKTSTTSVRFQGKSIKMLTYHTILKRVVLRHSFVGWRLIKTGFVRTDLKNAATICKSVLLFKWQMINALYINCTSPHTADSNAEVMNKVSVN